MADLKAKILEDLSAARKHLEYSHKKVVKIDLGGELDDEKLETLESFSSRFARYSDLIVSKYLRLLAREKDPAFRGSTIDILNAGEKYGWISDAKVWRRIRELRNVAAHEYEAADYKKLYKELIRLSSHLLGFKLP
jgi:uncharacterized protein YutE (UPF0331/DUF86 family)